MDWQDRSNALFSPLFILEEKLQRIFSQKSLQVAPYSILDQQDRSNGLTVSAAVSALQCDLPHFYDYPRISMTIKLT